MYCKVYWSNFKFSKRCLKNMLPIQLKQISENYLPQKNVFHIIFKLFSKKPFLSCLHLNGVIERLIVRHNLVTGFKLVLFILFTCHLTCQPKNGCGNPETKNSRQSGNIDEAKRQPVKNVFFLSQKCFFLSALRNDVFWEDLWNLNGGENKHTIWLRQKWFCLLALLGN